MTTGTGPRGRARLAVGALLVALIGACSSINASFPGVGVETDGGVVTGADSGGVVVTLDAEGPVEASSSGGGDAAAEPPPPTRILAVHASANLYDFRLCFGSEDGGILAVPAYPDDPADPMPETNYPGVPVGGAALLPPITLPDGPLTVYVVPAYYLTSQGYVAGSEPTCDELVPDDLGPQNVDYFVLPPVALPPAGGTIVLAIEGCAVGTGLAAGSAAQCGAGYGASMGNLSAFARTLAGGAADDAGTWTVQLAQLSPSFSPQGAADGGAAAIAYADPTADASVAIALPPLATLPAGSVGAPFTVPLSEAGVTAAYFTLSPSAAATVTEPLAAIQYFQAPSSDPFTYFGAPSTYFVAVVGDATDAAAPASLPDGAANPAFDGHGLHVIAYPETGN